jgi:lipopolysaccharide export system protein LptA
MKTTNFRVLIASALLFAFGGAANAERADRSKPMNVEADALRYDDLKQTNVFTGRVVMTKGTIVIRGARLDVRQDPDGYQYGVVVAEPGKRAFFRQKREGVDEFIEGEGETIEYDGKADVVKFIKRAEMRRYKGDVLNDDVSGAIIVFDNVTEVFTVDGNTSAPNTGNMQGRVRATLTPKGAAAAASAPAGAATQAPLRSSTTLGGEKK